MTSFEQAIARGKLEYLEKYKSGKQEDIDNVSKWMNYKVEYLEGRQKARIYTPTGVLEVTVKNESKRY